MNTIDWTNPDCHVSTNFKVKDCLYLPTWKRLANEQDGLDDTVKENLINICAKMEAIRVFLGNKPISVHCMYRPPLYNKLVKGSSTSGHLIGCAIDFHVVDFDGNNGCDLIRGMLEHKLEEFDIRMEDISSYNSRAWVHIDMKLPVTSRYFKP